MGSYRSISVTEIMQIAQENVVSSINQWNTLYTP